MVTEHARRQGLGKPDAPADPPERVGDCQLRHLPISLGHGLRAGRLLLHHRDPFDRALVGQAQMAGLTIITRDAWIPEYGVATITA